MTSYSVEFSYDEIGDTLYLYFSKSPVDRTERINESILIDYDVEGTIRGIEVLNFTDSKLDLNQLIKLNKDDLVEKVTAR